MERKDLLAPRYIPLAAGRSWIHTKCSMTKGNEVERAAVTSAAQKKHGNLENEQKTKAAVTSATQKDKYENLENEQQKKAAVKIFGKQEKSETVMGGEIENDG
jgi:hypothetical protein